jgi:hypothetical protein
MPTSRPSPGDVVTPPASGLSGSPSERPAAPDRPIFIVGCPRSGTTLMQLMLHAHPAIAIPPENRFLLELYDQREEFGDLREVGNRRKVARFIVRRRRSKLRDFGLDPDRTFRRIVRQGETIGSAAGVVFRDYAARFGKRRWGDKRPAYIQRLDVVLRMFPDAQVVHIVRDGRDCVSSLKRMPWWEGGVVVAIWTWRAAVIKGRRAAARLGEDAYIEVRYEDLVTAPTDELRRLCAFLGEDFDEAMLEPQQVTDVAVPERKVWHARTSETVDDSATQRWRRDLEPWELDIFEFVAARQMRLHGYELSRGRRPVPPPVPLLKFVKLNVLRTLGRVRNRRRDAERQRRYGRPVAMQRPQPSAGPAPTATGAGRGRAGASRGAGMSSEAPGSSVEHAVPTEAPPTS